MAAKVKRKAESAEKVTPEKKVKKDKQKPNNISKRDTPNGADGKPTKKVNFNENISPKTEKTERKDTEKVVNGSSENGVKTFNKKTRPGDPKKPFGKGKFPNKNFNKETPVKPADWAEFKKKKKELRSKRRQGKPLYDVMTQLKQLGEKIRCKNLNPEERNKLIDKLHLQVKGKSLYAKFVLTHDMARIIQILLKYGSPEIREEIAQELIPVTMQMMESKYGKFVVKRMLTYSNAAIRSSILRAMYGNAVKLASHVLSAPIFEYGYSTWATQQEKMHFIQEFFGDMFKQSKDNSIKHLRDVFKNSPDMKAAALGATKSNLSRILNKDLLDSGLVQSVLHQFLSECSIEDRTELLTQLAPHVVILSNSKDGARVVMSCIWHGSNKERKVAMKALKEHVLELSKHEHGHCSIIALLDGADDTVLLNKMIISEILKNVQDLAKDEWGRKVLLWLVAPADSSHFHPLFIKELDAGRESSTSKKPIDIRRKEILGYASSGLLKAITSSPKDWLSSGSIGVVSLAILKTGCGAELQEAFQSIAKTIVNQEWVIKEDEKETCGIEHAGLHMTLKKLAQHDKVLLEKKETTFGEVLLEYLDDSTMSTWLSLNRGCFLLIVIFENGSETTQNQLKSKINNNLQVLKKQSSPGAKILLKKLD